MSDPRILVTGFEPFPGAPENPTEWLIGALRKSQSAQELGERLRLEVLPVEYEAAALRLEAIGREFSPDIAIHFGLAQPAQGFRLERLARNANLANRLDNAGREAPAPMIAAGGDDIPSALPLEKIAGRLAAEGLPFEWSDDAGGYLCNYVFYLSCSRDLCTAMNPAMAGFIHVPLLDRQRAGQEALPSLSEEDLLGGADAIIDCCAAAHARKLPPR